MRIVWNAGSVETADKGMMVTMFGDSLAPITKAWSPSSSYQQLLTVGSVALEGCIFDMFTFEGDGPKHFDVG